MDNMIYIPDGRFWMGLSKYDIKRLAKRYDIHWSWLAPAMPEREIELPGFHIDKYPVTNADYYNFVLDSGVKWLYNKNNPMPEEIAKIPVVNLDYFDCEAYAAWTGKNLPTEEQWEKAARGRMGLLYPWGNMWDSDRCFCNASGTADGGRMGPVDAHPDGASPYGVMDMAGNACEWTRTVYVTAANVVKGGFFHQHEPFLFLSSYRGMSQLCTNAQDYIGFRCVREDQ